MNRPSSPWAAGSVTDRIHDDVDDEFVDAEDYDAYADYDDYDDDDYDAYGGYAVDHDDRRWLWVASVAGIVLLIAVAGTLMILSGGDSGTTSATVSPSTSRPVPYPSDAPSRTPSATALPPETITSVTPTPTAAPPSAIAEPTEVAPPPAASPGTVTYTVTGNRQLFDLVTIIWTDQQGALQTDVNVALPWTKQVTLDPGVSLTSVTATSVGGQLNCSITDGAGETLVAQNNNTMITNCTR
ncbi:hypothetical protein [Mycolicibacterium stellerae]|uniref:hypothetical protein n=1 Tax=Mycolicibacterium stellerae TaxID=2358193 RepID=UPI000F0B267C|nr:hypothetical protein [Mycolicibacterium stellerae]